MKRHTLSSALLTLLCMVLFAGLYPVIVWAIAQAAPNHGKGFIAGDHGHTYYQNIGQQFTEDKYFWSRPSAVNYNAAGSGGSNKAASNPEYLATVRARIDTFMAHNPGVRRQDIPSDIVTASGSGLDPHISVAAAIVQVRRIARVRGIAEDRLTDLVTNSIQHPLASCLGPETINVTDLNNRLDHLTQH